MRPHNARRLRAIALTKIALAAAKAMRAKYTDRADVSWLLSAAGGGAGTVLAVVNGAEARQWTREIETLTAQLTRLESNLV